jgi:hypothetical protein
MTIFLIKNISGYNGPAGPFEAVVNMGTAQPPQRKGSLPQYASNKLVEFQHKSDELESLGIFQPPENLGITVEYLNPSFLNKKPSGGHRLVTTFADVGRYRKPEPSLYIARCRFYPPNNRQMEVRNLIRPYQRFLSDSTC